MDDLNGNGLHSESESDESLVRLVASALFRVATEADSGRQITTPYPPLLQRTLDRVAATFLLRGFPPPQSLPDLFSHCRKPLVEWPIKLPDSSCGESDCLLDGEFITNFCDEWAEKDVADVEGEFSQRELITEVRSICRSLDSQETYVAFRKTMIEHPVIKEFDLQQKLIDTELDPVADQLRRCYLKAPACHQDGDSFRACVVCNGLLLRSSDSKFVCENETCRVSGEFATGRRLKADEGVMWLRREHRRYIAAPGLAELSLFRKLSQLNSLEVELWPELDNYDILVRFLDGEVWAIDVKDQRCPYLLAKNAIPPANLPRWERAYFVFPDRRSERNDYLRAFKNHTQIISGRVNAMFESDFIKKVKQEIRSKKKCATQASGDKA